MERLLTLLVKYRVMCLPSSCHPQLNKLQHALEPVSVLLPLPSCDADVFVSDCIAYVRFAWGLDGAGSVPHDSDADASDDAACGGAAPTGDSAVQAPAGAASASH